MKQKTIFWRPSFLPQKSLFMLIFGIFLLGLSGCFGGMDLRGSIDGYQKNVVKTKGGSFRIGALGPHWQLKKNKLRALTFFEKRTKSNITISAFCKNSAPSGSLTSLAGQILHALKEKKVLEKEMLMLDGRKAYRSSATGYLDGALVTLDQIVLKMNQCVFDFVYIANPADYQKFTNEFKQMALGFQFISGPKLDGF